MPSNYPTPEQLRQETALLQRMAKAGYAGIPTGGNPNYSMIKPEKGNPNLSELPPLEQLEAISPLEQLHDQGAIRPAEEQLQTLRQLGSAPNANYKSMKAPSIIPLSAVIKRDELPGMEDPKSPQYPLSLTPQFVGNKNRGLEAVTSVPFAGGDLTVQGMASRMFGRFKGEPEYDVRATFTKGFADGGFVDGKSLEEPIGQNTEQQINSLLSNGGLASTARPDLASFAKGGDVDVNDFQPPLQQQQPNAMEVLKAEFAKRGLDFNKFIASPPVMQQALANAQNMGIKGDTMLAHINEREAKLLKEHGGSGDINPNTGLPMFEDGEGEGNGNGNGTSSSQGEQGPGIGNNDSFGANTGEQGPGLGLNDSFGVSTNEQGPGLGLNDSFGGLSAQGPGLGLNDSFGAQPNAQEQGPGLGLNDSFGGLSAQGPGLGLNDSFGAPTNEQGPGLGLNDTFGANPSVQGPGLGLNDAFGPPSVLGDVEFGIHNYDPVTGVPSVTGIVSTTGQNPSISAALSAISQNATTSQVAAALANAVQAATQTPAATPATPTTTTATSTPSTTTAAPASPSVAATSTPTAIGTPATKAAQETTLAEDISSAINNAITNALNNPVATAINTGLSLASPPLGLANMVSGLAGYGTLGSGITNAFGGQQSASKSDVASDLGGGRDSSGGDGGTGGASLAGVQTGTTPTTTSSVLASLANPTTTSNNQFRQFAGYAPNPLNYGYGPAYNFYTYKSAKGGKVSPLKAMRKA